jgi:hypothetical protein
MMAAIARVDVSEDLATFIGGDAALEYPGDAAFVEFVVDDGKGLAAAHEGACLCFVRRQYLALEVAEVRLGPVPSIRGECD